MGSKASKNSDQGGWGAEGKQVYSSVLDALENELANLDGRANAKISAEEILTKLKHMEKVKGLSKETKARISSLGARLLHTVKTGEVSIANRPRAKSSLGSRTSFTSTSNLFTNATPPAETSVPATGSYGGLTIVDPTAASTAGFV
jgi:hypothetical protein